MKDRFTRVLKGHIAVARARFPDGHARLAARQLRAPVSCGRPGSITPTAPATASAASSSVHEGPQRISPVGSAQAGGDEPLKAGMILSNEPGYYKTGEYGIRIENLVLVVPVEVEGAEKTLLGFETLTFAPIDRNLIETAMLSDERAALGRRLSRRGAADRRPAARRARPRPGSKRPARRSTRLLVGLLARASASRACALRRFRFSRSAAASRFARSSSRLGHGSALTSSGGQRP